MKTVVQCWWLFSLVNSLCCVGVLHPPLNYFLSTHLPLPLLCVLPRRWPDLSHLCLVTLLTPAGYKYLSLPASSFMLSTHSEYQWFLCWYSLYFLVLVFFPMFFFSLFRFYSPFYWLFSLWLWLYLKTVTEQCSMLIDLSNIY